MAESPQERTDHIAAGQAALERGAWQEARGRFAAALADGEAAEAHEGLAVAAQWQEDWPAAFEARHAAFRLYRAWGDREGAARMALRLGHDYGAVRRQSAVAEGWCRRAERLLAGVPPGTEHVRLALLWAEAAGAKGDRVAAWRHATEARRAARAVGAGDLEVLAIAVAGRSLVALGRVGEGMERLDEAAAAATSGEVSDPEIVIWACCFLISACERVRDYPRAAEWCQVAEEHCRRAEAPSLFAWCRSTYAGALMWWGAWERAEAELRAATDLLRTVQPLMASGPVVRLAELRRRQGRRDEAEGLLAGLEGDPDALLARASLALDREDPRAAAELAERFLRTMSDAGPVDRLPGVEILAVARAAQGLLPAARTAAAEVAAVAEAVGTAPLQAAAHAAQGAVSAAAGDHDAARRALEEAVDLYAAAGAPYESGVARLRLARSLSALGRRADAGREARSARDTLRAVGAAADAARAEALLGAREPSGATPTGGRGPLTRRETEVLRLVAEGLGDRAIAARLVVSEHTVHRHVANILAKLSVPTRSAATAMAAREGLI